MNGQHLFQTTSRLAKRFKSVILEDFPQVAEARVQERRILKSHCVARDFRGSVQGLVKQGEIIDWGGRLLALLWQAPFN